MSVTPTPSTSISKHQQRLVDRSTYQTNLEIGELAKVAPKNSTAAIVAQELLKNLAHPDTVTYNGVLKAFAKSPSLDGAQRAQELLEEMEEIHHQQVRAHDEWLIEHQHIHNNNNGTANHVIQSAPRILVKTNVRSYSTVMDAWSRRSGRVKNAAQHCQDVFDRLEFLYNTTGDVSYLPNTITYNTVITAWAKEGGQEDRVESLLEKMGPLADTISYNALLLAFARSGHPDAGQRAEAILRRMPLKNSRSYTTVIDAYSRSHEYHTDSADRAHNLLDEMEDIYDQTRDVMMRPNCVSYSTVINAYSLSNDPKKAQKAWDILQHMKELAAEGKNSRARPSLVSYNSVLNACATSMPTVHAPVTHMVQSLYREIMADSTLQADHVTFATGK